MVTESSTTRRGKNGDPAASHGWIGTESVRTTFGDFAFRNGYPTPTAAAALLDQLKLNRAIEVYLTQIPAVAVFAEHRGLGDFGARRSNQIVIWENLMDAKTILLGPGKELDPDRLRQRLVSDLPLLWTAAAAVRKDVGLVRRRTRFGSLIEGA